MLDLRLEENKKAIKKIKIKKNNPTKIIGGLLKNSLRNNPYCDLLIQT
jgi:hypothetical protein